jgi:predicted phosphodiesterase
MARPMRYLILSDIHANDEALSAVLARVRRRKYDRVVILGDFVGYGASPNDVIDRLRALRHKKIMIRGNHDKVVCGLESGDLFNPVALAAARWTAAELTPRNRRFLETLPVGPVAVDGAFAICHGSPRDEDAYIFSDYDAFLNFSQFEPAVCFFGHSHIPSVFTLEPHGIRVELVKGARARMALDPACRYLVNPGSIGQPRDRDPSAAYAIYDGAERVVEFARVPYDVEKSRRKIHEAGLPGILGDRLLVGT